ncbi:ATP-dependent nuclease, partial [Actinomycetospora sp. C-140]
RVISSLQSFARRPDAQAVVATHSPAMLRRVAPESVRYLRLDAHRVTSVREISLPTDDEAEYKYVRQAVQAYPELYFARLVVLGEGDTEEVIIPRLLAANGLSDDESSITVTPLGGRHVNHFWRLLNDLDIPHITLLDLDSGRFRAGWDRLRYALEQLEQYREKGLGAQKSLLDELPRWNASESVTDSWLGRELIELLERYNVFFSAPLDLDFSMLRAFDDQYEAHAPLEPPAPDLIKAVLGKAGDSSANKYHDNEKELFGKYHELFQLGSKPTTHLAALAEMTDRVIRKSTPRSLARMLGNVQASLERLPE